MVIVENELLFYLVLVIVALLHMIFGRIANIYDRKIYQENITNDIEWLHTVQPYMEVSTSFLFASLLALIVFVIALVSVYGFKQAFLTIVGLLTFSIAFGFIEDRKTCTMFGEDKLLETEERLVNLLAIEKNKKKK